MSGIGQAVFFSLCDIFQFSVSLPDSRHRAIVEEIETETEAANPAKAENH
jgi:hypothetical protein